MAPSGALTVLTGETELVRPPCSPLASCSWGHVQIKFDSRGADAARVAAGSIFPPRMASVSWLRNAQRLRRREVSRFRACEEDSAGVDLCGQHEHQRLMKPASHGPLLDAWAADEVEKPLGESTVGRTPRRWRPSATTIAFARRGALLRLAR